MVQQMKLKRNERAALLTALRELYARGPNDPHLGICWNLGNILISNKRYVDAYAFVSQVSMGWPLLDPCAYIDTDTDGVLSVPYPVGRQYDADDDRLPYWEGDQLCKRTALIEYLIAYLENYKA